MLRSTLLVAIFAALAGTAGCGDESTAATTEPMTPTVAEMGDALDELDAVVAAHATEVANAADLAGAQATEDDYDMAVMDHHHHLESLVEHMAMCTKDGAAPDTEDATVTLEKIDKELAAHETAMADAADLAAAQTEETRHQGEISTHSDSLHAHHDSMAAMADQYTCPMGDDSMGH